MNKLNIKNLANIDRGNSKYSIAAADDKHIPLLND